MQTQRTAGDHPLWKETSKDLDTIVKLPYFSDDAEPPAFNISQPTAAVTFSLWDWALGPQLCFCLCVWGDPESFLKESFGLAHGIPMAGLQRRQVAFHWGLCPYQVPGSSLRWCQHTTQIGWGAGPVTLLDQLHGTGVLQALGREQESQAHRYSLGTKSLPKRKQIWGDSLRLYPSLWD